MSSAFYYYLQPLFSDSDVTCRAELAAMFQDKQGGVFRWVGEAYGKKTGLPCHLGTMD